VYDRFGNRLQQTNYTGTCMTPSYTLQTGKYWISGFSYDLAGDMIGDGIHSYQYDAEGRLASVDSGSTATYVYDAGGTRVRRIVGGVAYDDVYDLGGHVISDFLASGGTWNRGEVYAGGMHLATYENGTTYFAHSDWLGTERVRSLPSGSIFTPSLWTSYPFGEGSATPNPSPAHFTGKERDTESGNDYFGARYYASSMGRWMSPDLPFADQDTENPQSWNLYSYVRNNPLNRFDDSGMLTIIVGGTGYDPHSWNYSHSPLTSEAQSHFQDPAVGFLYWSGGLSDRDRIAGAEQLRKMINNYSFAPGEQLNIIAHSHGGNVALLAAQGQLNHPIDNLITLGTPGVGEYAPNPNVPADWRNIGAWYNIQGSTDWVPSLDSDTNSRNRSGASNFTVPTTGFGHFGEAHTALWQNSGVRGQWWSWWSNQQQQHSAPCARTGASDSLGNSTGMSGCQ
jgi:RHS repeat-associated protein